MSDPDRYPLTPLEVACGITFGPDPDAPPFPEPHALGPRAALEDSVLRGLERPPCLVSFSGGRDSSAVLAVATHVARREGLPLPIPVTNRFPNAPESDEAGWQELTVAHLRLTDWIRLSFTHELDWIGPHAQEALTRHGVLYPPNSHFHAPMLDEATGGALLTGKFGDEVMGGSRLAGVRAIITRQRRPGLRDAARVGYSLTPQWIRLPFERRRSMKVPWLAGFARRRAAEELAKTKIGQPLHWGRSLEWMWRSRYHQSNRWASERLAAARHVRVVHPFADPVFLASAAVKWSFAGPSSREQMLAGLVGELLPNAVVRRATKASFDDVFWNRHSAAFLADWDGSGLGEYPVETETLAEAWRRGRDNRSVLLLQAAWLTSTISSNYD